MPDLKDELDALFEDEGEPQAEEAAEEKAEETADEEKTDDKAKGLANKKSKLIGARTGAVVTGKKVPGKATVAAKPAPKAPEPTPEPEEPPPSHGSRSKAAAAPSAGGGGIKLLLAVSLLLNVVVLIVVILALGKLGTLQDQVTTTNSNVTAAATMSRAEVGVYTDRGGVDTAILFYLPKDVNKFPLEGKAYRVSLEKLIQNTAKE